jgi:succinoglycan biosynthesis protein ExoM
MNSITICIPTFKRPLFLKKLVLSIVKDNFDESLIGDVSIIIVDNDGQKSAETIVKHLEEEFKSIYKIQYFNYPEKGLSNVRNELIRIALCSEPDYLVFIDDDEYVTSGWLNELVKTAIITDADAARGPVLAVTDEPVPDNIWCWFERETYPDYSQIFTLTTGNLILKRASLAKYNLWFDSRFDETGAEDSFFGVQLIKKGGTIFWAAKAISYENIPLGRTKISWLMKRFYNGANTYTYILRLEKRHFKLFIKTIISFLYIVSGTLTLVLAIMPIRKRYWGLLKMAEGFGSMAGLLSIKYYEYK